MSGLLSRLAPPPIVVDADLGWVLRAAFTGAGGAPPADPARAVDLARRLGLSARIAARAQAVGEWEALRTALGGELARSLAIEQAKAEAQAASLTQLHAEVAAITERSGVGFAALKFAALAATPGLALPGRSAADVDLLVETAGIERLASALREAGYRSSDIPGFEHQLPALVHPRRGAVELHTKIPGVRIGGRGWATYEDLRREALLVETPAGQVPARDVLVAHALAHGLVQHVFAPRAYCLLQTFADLADLGFAVEDSPLERFARFERLAGWLRRGLEREDLRATRDLVAALTSGAEVTSAAARRLLDHALAGRLDPGYESALRLADLRAPLSDRPAILARGAAIRRALLPSAAELAAIYGPAGGPLGRLGQRLRRPFDLVGRTWRALRRRPR